MVELILYAGIFILSSLSTAANENGADINIIPLSSTYFFSSLSCSSVNEIFSSVSYKLQSSLWHIFNSFANDVISSSGMCVWCFITSSPDL